DERERVDARDRRVAHRGEPGHGEPLHQRDALEQHELAALVGTVRDHTGPGAEEEHGAELRGGEQPEGEAAVGQLQHQQRLGDHVEPGADLRDALPDEEQPEVAVPQRFEGGAGEVLEPRHALTSSTARRDSVPGSPLTSSSSTSSAASSAARRSGTTEESRFASQAVFCALDAASSSSPSRVVTTRQIRRSCSSTIRSTSPRPSRRSTTLVTDGGAMPSCSASAPSATGPCTC